MKNYRLQYLLLIIFFMIINNSKAQYSIKNKQINVIGYYDGDTLSINNYPVEKLTHLIFCFGHLNGNRFFLNKRADTVVIQRMIALKQRNPQLKVMLSLGGWSGCKTCSEVFATDSGRSIFTQSVVEYLNYFKADGIDLDWEYPAIKGFPGHPYSPADKEHFTKLIQQLRKALGRKKEISFAAGGFTKYLLEAVDWKNTAPYVNRINLMSYDLVSGFSTTSGHQTPLYSTPQQIESVDNAVRYLLSIGIASNKITIGAAFYARIFEVNDTLNNGLYQPCHFKQNISYKNIDSLLISNHNLQYHFDSIAQAPYYWDNVNRWLVTFDNSASIQLKVEYSIRKKLDGIMFWQLRDDKTHDGLLDILDTTKKKYYTSKPKE
jgi:chitinase